MSRGYQSPQFLSFASFKDADGKWQRSRSIVLSLSMKSGLQVADFGNAVQAELSEVRRLLPKIYHHQHRSLPAVSDAVGRFGALHYSLPIVLTASLVASRLVSMTFIPLLGFHLLRPSKRQAPSIEERRNTGFAKHDLSRGECHDTPSLCRARRSGGAAALLGMGLFAVRDVKQAFFPQGFALNGVEVGTLHESPCMVSLVGAAMFRTDRRSDGSQRGHAALGARALRRFRARSQAREMARA